MKATTSSIISLIQGKLGKLAGKRHKTGQVISRKSTPYEISQAQRSTGQQAAQQKYASILTTWQALTQEKKDGYNQQGATLKISGWNLYLKLNLGFIEAIYGTAEYGTGKYS